MYRSAVATYYVLHIERTSISYNHLNLPAKVSQNGSDLAKYSYLASGSKSKAEDGSLTLEGASMPEGRLTVNGVRWYVKDHLGSVRAVVDGSTGGLLAVTDYEAYGKDTANATASSYLSAAPAGETFRDHFTGKEDQGPDFGTAYTDFGARQYSPALRRWLVPDPLSEKYYGVSPYAYCAGDPVNMVDEDGRDGMVKGDGTKNNPYTIVAVYLYDSSITQDQLDGLNAAIADYNNSCTRVKDKTGNIVYVTFDLSSRLSENPKEERLSFNFKDEHGNPRYYGNIVTVEEDCESERYGYATMMEIGFSEGLIGLGIEKGMNPLFSL